MFRLDGVLQKLCLSIGEVCVVGILLVGIRVLLGFFSKACLVIVLFLLSFACMVDDRWTCYGGLGHLVSEVRNNIAEIRNIEHCHMLRKSILLISLRRKKT